VNRLTWAGHATTLLELGGVRLLTDPFLRSRLAHLVRVPDPVDPAVYADLDAVLISHLHHDHFDVPSLRMLDPQTRVIVPEGGGTRARALGFGKVTELRVGASVAVGIAEVSAVPAVHDGRRGPRGEHAEAVGFVVAGGGARAYFAGDTDLFEGMADLADPPLDVALLPVWGWGPSLGAGHLDPARAAEALVLLRPAVAVPIHWGTLYPRGVRRLRPRQLREPPERFLELAGELAADTRVAVLAPGATMELPA
jgi:L-ascorbate metabolism protein UlaG (beta-lactamase superfamily)